MDRRTWTVAKIQQQELREWANRQHLADEAQEEKNAGERGRNFKRAAVFALAMVVILATSLYFSTMAIGVSARPAAVITDESSPASGHNIRAVTLHFSHHVQPIRIIDPHWPSLDQHGFSG